MLDPSRIRNPVLEQEDNLRDPAVLPVDGGYHVFYTRYSNRAWVAKENWSVASVFTRDFVTFENDRDVSPKGYASPGDPIRWHGRIVLPFTVYPIPPARLCYSESRGGSNWSQPIFFMPEANELSWNTRGRAIDPTFVVDGDALHCYFVGSCDTEGQTADQLAHANLLGHAITTDPDLKSWRILSKDAPLIGRSKSAPDGVENVAVFRTGDLWTMIYSEGLANQRLAYARSRDLHDWQLEGPIDIPVQPWMSAKHGAPFIWREGDGFWMMLMGEDDAGRTTLGFLSSNDGLQWQAMPVR